MNTPSLHHLTAMLLLASVTGPLAAQEPNGSNSGKVRIEVIRSENGQEQRTTREFDLADGERIEDALREMGISNDLESDTGWADLFDLAIPTFDLAPLDDIRMAFAMPHLRDLDPAFEEERGYLGVNYKDGKNVSGAIITNVSEGTPAAKAGLRKDDVITSVGGRTVSNGATLVEAVAAHKPGTKVKVEYLRGKQKKSATVELGTNPNSWAQEFDHDMDIDIDLDDLAPYFDAEDSPWAPRPFLGILGGSEEGTADGVVIAEVLEGSPAERIGLQEGDVLQRINGKTVHTFEDVVSIINAAKPGEQVQLDILRDGVAHSASGELGEQARPNFPPAPPARMFRSRPMPGMNDREHDEMRRDMEQLRADMEHLRRELRGNRPEHTGRARFGAATVTTPEEVRTLTAKGVKGLDRPLELPELEARLAPDGQRLHVDFNAPNRGDLGVALHDSNGKAVYQEHITAYKGRYDRTVDVSELPDGTYFLVIQQNGAAVSRKLVKG